MNGEIHQKIIPKELKLVLVVFVSVFLLALIASEGLEIRDRLRNQETITFSGEGKAIGIPDVASVSFSVITERATAKEATTENAEKMNEVINFIKRSGIDEKDVKTQAYSLRPRYDFFEGRRILKGYELSSTLAVKIRDLVKISAIIDGAVSRGANQVGNIQFVIDDPEKLKEEARLKAIENAKERAQSVAEATGLKLGKIVSFSETSSPPPPILRQFGLGGVLEETAAPEIEKGSLEIKVNVLVTFELRGITRLR